MPSTGTAPTGIDRGKCSSTGTTPEQQQQLPLPPPQAITTAPSATLSTTGGGSTNVSSQRKMRSNGVASPPKHGTLLSVIVATSLFLSLIQLLDPLLLLHQPPTLTPVDVGLQDFQRGHLLLHNKLNLTHEQVAIGREPIIDLLHEAGVYGSLTPQEVHLLPKWHHVIDLYGTHVRVVGKERCEAFRQRVPHRARKVGVAGMFNTGTNLLDIHLHRNVQGVESLWQVPWGKHRMPQVKWNHTAQGFERTNKEHVLPVVMVRDPLSWLQSMCRTHYAAHWRHNARHCPNLIPTEQDRNTFPHLQETFNVSVHFDTNSHFQFDSLAHFWSEYHLQYMNVDYPILFSKFWHTVLISTHGGKLSHHYPASLHPFSSIRRVRSFVVGRTQLLFPWKVACLIDFFSSFLFLCFRSKSCPAVWSFNHALL